MRYFIRWDINEINSKNTDIKWLCFLRIKSIKSWKAQEIMTCHCKTSKQSRNSLFC